MKLCLQIYFTIILWIGILFGERTVHILPFDWSGQNGLISVNGQLFWNQDWMSGPLYFDGTFSNYPFRYGSSYLESFQPVNFNEIPDSCFYERHFPTEHYSFTGRAIVANNIAKEVIKLEKK